MDTLLPFALLCFTSFFTLTNPLGTMPVFLTMTKGLDDEERRHMLQARFTNTKLKDEEIKTYANDISITPLSIPMLCGPGAIANGIMLMDDANTWTMKGILIGIIGLIYFITYLILRASTRLVSILGETGNNVMMRLMGLILMVIAVECFVSGFRPILIDIIQSSRI